MNRDETARLLSLIAESLRTNPDQFTYQVSVSYTGAQGIATAPGATGISGVAFGGGIGFRSSVSITDADISIANRQADEAFRSQIQSAVSLVEEIATEMKSSQPDHSRVEQLLTSLSKLSIPVVVIEVTRALVQAVFGAVG